MEACYAYIARDRLRALARGEPLAERARGAALFADISGFTPLTEALARELGPRFGAEELTRHLNAIYDALIAEVDCYGGSVIGFSGDAITCWFDDNAAPNPAAPRAAACAGAMQAAMAALGQVRTPAGRAFDLTLKVALAAGPARRLAVGDPAIQRLDALAGTTLDRLAAAEQRARPGEIIAAPEVVAALGQALAVRDWRVDPDTGLRFACVDPPAPDQRLQIDQPYLAALSLDPAQVRPWLLGAVYDRLAAGQGDLPTELRPATALFLRFGGLDYDQDDHAGEKLDAFVCWVQAVVARYGGTLLQLTFGDKGSYLYAAFGAPTAHENDAERAARTALELLAPPPALAWVGQPQIGVTCGTLRTGSYGGSGRVVYGALGDPVNVAARLMLAAGPGQAIVSQAAQTPCAGLFRWEPLAPLQVKGKADALAALRLLGARDQAEPAFHGGTLVGRASELERLLAAAEPLAAASFAGVCYLGGEAGIGKSRLVHEFRHALHQAATGLQWFSCPSAEILRTSFHPFSYFLRGFFDQSAERGEQANKARFDSALDDLLASTSAASAPGDVQPPAADAGASGLAAELNRTRSFLGALVGLRWQGSLYEQLEPRLRFENTIAAFVALVQAASQRAPVLIELEDAHWLDADSRDMVAALIRALVGFPVLLLAIARPDDAGRPFRLVLPAGTPTSAVDLQPLAPTASRSLAAQALGHNVSDELAAFLHQRTGGNPFFLEQLALDLRERGLLERQSSAGEAGIGLGGRAISEAGAAAVPDSVNAVLVARLDRLASPVREVVQTAAVLGREWSLPVLAGMRRDDAEIQSKVRRAADEQIWAALGASAYLFRHVLLRDAAYAMQARARLRQLHAQAAQAIEAEYGESLASHYAGLAYHYRAAEDRQRELRYAVLAGEQAAARYANVEAAGYLGRALELTPPIDAAGRAELLLAREKIYDLIGDRAAQLADIESAAPIAVALGPARAAEVALRRARYGEATGDYELSIAAARQAIEYSQQAGDRDQEAGGQLAWGQALLQQSDYLAARERLSQVLAQAQAAGLPALEVEALRALGIVADYQGDYPLAHSFFARALERYRALGSRQGESRVLNSLGLVARHQGDHAAAQAYYRQALSNYQAIGDRRGEGVVVSNLGVISHSQGDYAQAHQAFVQSLQIRRAVGDRQGAGVALINLGSTADSLGDYRLAQDYYEQARQLFQAIGDRRRESVALGGLSLVCHHLGDNAAALALSQDALRIARQIEARAEIASALLYRGHALAGLEALDQAEGAYQEAERTWRELDVTDQALEAYAGLARLALARGDAAAALAHAETILPFLADRAAIAGADEPLRIDWSCYQALQAARDARAKDVLAAARRELRQRADRISDQAARRMFLENVPYHREIASASN